MPVSRVTEYIITIILKDLHIDCDYVMIILFLPAAGIVLGVPTRLERNCSWCSNKAGNATLHQWLLEHAGKLNKPTLS